MDLTKNMDSSTKAIIVDDLGPPLSENNKHDLSNGGADSAVNTEMILLPGPEPARSFRGEHKRKRSRYYEAEIHSSEATVEEEDLPSQRLARSKTFKDAIVEHRKSAAGYASNNN